MTESAGHTDAPAPAPAGPFDALVIGAGPAGSTAAALLAEKGRRVLVIEKEKFPRYHVGESLMPFCYFTLERLGLVEQLNATAYPRKLSVQFASQNGRVSQPFYFFQHYDHPSSTTWQVPRAEFDLMILDKARENGAEVLEETKVKGLLMEGGRVVGVSAEGRDGTALEFRAPITIDASGRDCLASAKQGWRVRDPELNKIAIWTYYRGAVRDPGLDAGATTVAYIPHKGWFWYIPMADDIVSVGVVAERDYLYRDSRDPAEIFAREIKENRWVEEHLAPGEQFGQYWVTGEYSYRARHPAADGLVLCGDAFAFLDPVFSSGVFLALFSGEKVADAVDAALSAGDTSGSRFAAYGEELCKGIEAMRKLVYAFYDPGFSFGKLVRAHPDVRGRLTDCLIGDLFEKDYDGLFQAVAEIARIPEPIQHGRQPAGAAAPSR